MRAKLVPLVVLVAALAGLAGSGARAVGCERNHGYGWMHSSKSGWMMRYRSGSAQPARTIDKARTQAQAALSEPQAMASARATIHLHPPQLVTRRDNPSSGVR